MPLLTSLPIRVEKRPSEGDGQSTIEAAFLAPIVLGCILLLAQPAIILYDRVVMQSAAGEACRLLCTLPPEQKSLLDGYVRRRLAAVPQQDCFHVHQEDECSWDIQSEGDQSSEKVTVTIENKVKPLPLIDFACNAVGATDDDGCWTVRASASLDIQPSWVENSPSGEDPSGWVGDWL